MRRAYPSLLPTEHDEGARLTWEGMLCPLRSVAELDAILEDLENDRRVEIIGGEFAEIVHASNCQVSHGQHHLAPLLTEIVQNFRIRIVDFGTDQQPQAIVVESPLPVTKWRHRIGDDGICVYAPWEYPWQGESSSIVEFVDHSLIFLFKQVVYLQTGVWLGRETPHDLEFLLTTISPTDRCSCGSVQTYEECCRPRHFINAALESWLRSYRLDGRRFERVVAAHPCRPNLPGRTRRFRTARA